jgi:PAS domain S-box-containing protein
MPDTPSDAENERVRHTVRRAALTRRLRRQGASGRFSLASSPPLHGWAVRLLWTLGLTTLAVVALAAADGPALPGVDYGLLYVFLFLIPGTICLVRAVLIAEQRLTWAAFGVGMWCFGAGSAYWHFVVAAMQSPPYPSGSDALWLGYYAGGLVGLVALMRSGLTRFNRGISIDLLVAALAIATVAAALLLQPISDLTGGNLGAVAMNLAYPLIDALIVSLILGVFIIHGWRPGGVWVLLAVVWILQTVADTVYLHQVAGGTYVTGGMMDVTWPPLMFLIAWVAWQRPASARRAWQHGSGTLAVTIGFAAVGLFVLVYDRVNEVGLIADVLATLTVTFGFVRAAMTFADMRSLAASREMSVQRSLILDAAGEGIVGTDSDGIVTFMNPAGKRMTGYAPGEMTGHSLHDRLHHTKADGSPYPIEECPMHASLLDRAIHHCDSDVYWRKDGTSFPVEYTSTPIVQDGRIRGAVVVFHDVTERRTVERIRDEFTSVVSHELRTPLTSIRGSLGLLESGVLGPLPERAQRMTQIAVENTDRLVRLINDILDLERLDSDGLQLRQSTCDAEQLIARATEGLLSAAVAAGVRLAVDTAPAAFEADADRVIQTLTNLIGNAVKFSPRGGTVQISSVRRSDEILFTVRDSGRGIPADSLESIFGRFQQVDSTDSRQSGGTGLGLAICRSIVELHGGRIWACSGVGQGSTFSFVIPAADEQVSDYGPRAGGTRGSVLMCDDNAEILEITGTLLEERGYHVLTARRGERAVERARADHPDVILLEVQLPGTSGAQTVAALREHHETSSIPVVVLSVLPRSDEQMAAGAFVDWIEKPADPDELVAALDRAIGPAADVFRALFIERDPAVAELLRALFARHGVACFGADDGRQALALCGQIRPDLLVLDDDLPAIDGLDIKSWLRGQPSFGALPMVAYDARHLEAAEDQRRSTGAVTQILTKGQISAEEFQWRVMTLLARPHIPSRTAGASHEPEAHPARR